MHTSPIERRIAFEKLTHDEHHARHTSFPFERRDEDGDHHTDHRIAHQDERGREHREQRRGDEAADSEQDQTVRKQVGRLRGGVVGVLRNVVDEEAADGDLCSNAEVKRM